MEKFSRWLTPVVAIFFATALSVTASSTVGTDISTGGNLAVTGNSLLTGTLGVTGATTLTTLTASTTAAGADINLKAIDQMNMSTEGNAVFDFEGSLNIYNSINTGAGYNSLMTMDSSEIALYADNTSRSVDFIVNADGTDLQTTGSGTYVTFDINGSSDELYLAENEVYIGNAAAFYPPKSATPPLACSAGVSGAIYYDTNLNQPCFCNATDWKQFSDASTTCS